MPHDGGWLVAMNGTFKRIKTMFDKRVNFLYERFDELDRIFQYGLELDTAVNICTYNGILSEEEVTEAYNEWIEG